MDCGFQVLDSGFPVSRTFIPDFDGKLLDSGIRISLYIGQNGRVISDGEDIYILSKM